MYLLTDAAAIGALADRARAGCDVRVILEPSPYQNEDAQPARVRRAGRRGRRCPLVVAAILVHAREGADRRPRPAGRDDAEPDGRRAGRQPRVRRFDDDPADVAAAEAVFAADATGRRRGARGRLVTSPDASRAVLTRPDRRARGALAVETEELTDPAVVGALMAARERGVALTLVWPGPATPEPRSRRLRRPAPPCAPWTPRHPRQGRRRRRARALPRLGELHADLAGSPIGSSACGSTTATSPGRARRDRRRRRRPRRSSAAGRVVLGAICMADEDPQPPDGPEGLSGGADRAAEARRADRRRVGDRKSCSGSAASRSRVSQSSQRNLRWLVIGRPSARRDVGPQTARPLDRGGFVHAGTRSSSACSPRWCCAAGVIGADRYAAPRGAAPRACDRARRAARRPRRRAPDEAAWRPRRRPP